MSRKMRRHAQAAGMQGFDGAGVEREPRLGCWARLWASELAWENGESELMRTAIDGH